MIKISGVVETVIFSNPENGYSVCEVAVGDELITMTGMLPDVAEGEKITASGEWVTHAEYGDQFSVEYSERVMPATEEETEKFLASGLLPPYRQDDGQAHSRGVRSGRAGYNRKRAGQAARDQGHEP